MIRVAVCDDEEAMCAALEAHIVSYFREHGLPCETAVFSSGETLLKSCMCYDAVFLDIQMDGLSGMETAKRLRAAGYDGFLVFVTVLAEYVYDAFDVEAADYLVKPVDSARLGRVLDRFCARMRNQPDQRLFVPLKGGGCRFVPFGDILYCEANNHRISLYTWDGPVSAPIGIRSLESRLDRRFFRCHRSYLVNLAHVRGCDGGLALLSGGQRLPVSRLREQAFTQAVLDYMVKGAL